MPHPIETDTIKIAVLGAAGGIGQSLSLLLKTQLTSFSNNRHVHLALYDVNADGVRGVAADLSHVDTPITLTSHSPADSADALRDCLINAALVLIPAGVPRKPGMTREDLFAINAKIVGQLGGAIAQHCDLSRVFVLVISNPVNSLVPVMVETLYASAPAASAGVERRVFGITHLDLVRASTFLHEHTVNRTEPSYKMPYVPVIGGHSGDTIVPLFSLASEQQYIAQQQLESLVHRVQYGGDEIVKAKNGQGSATLSMAHAAFQVVKNFVLLLTGAADTISGIFYVSLLDRAGQPACPGAAKLLAQIDGCTYFAAPVTVTRSQGVVDVDYGILGKISTYEREKLLPLCLPKLKTSIEAGRTVGTTV
ncbi:hypothetical protein HG537_0E02350 [Torulaspora globosa]|uniref:malate dehydrogenase n=1 Tax=Torulaspora globosa TaxID=48254 RepID=A0A7H9HU47_9SACH|nr:hypothetical protein HG537_0E02350 [Torulaspora sp. CBS 2947]